MIDLNNYLIVANVKISGHITFFCDTDSVISKNPLKHIFLVYWCDLVSIFKIN